MRYTWKLVAEMKLANLPTTVTGPGGTSITISLRTSAQLKARLSCGISIEPKDTPLIPEFYALVHDPRRIPPRVDQSIDVDIYDAGSIVLPAAALLFPALANVFPNMPTPTATLTQPTVSISPGIQWMSINGGKGVSGMFECTATFTPGTISIDPGFSIPMPSPFPALPVPPVEVVLGSPKESKVVGEYQLIYTDYADLTPYDPSMGTLRPYSAYSDEPVGPPGATDVRIEVTRFDATGDQTDLAFSVTADEGGSPMFYEHIAMGPTGPTICNAKSTDFSPPIEPRKRRTRP